MMARNAFVALALALLIGIPAVTSAAIVQKWQTAAGVSYRVVGRGDFNGDGVYDLITEEISGANARLGIRSAVTGALQAQTALAYKINDIKLQDLDSDGNPEMIIQDLNTGYYICFNWSTSSSTLAVRWTSSITFNGPTPAAFVDFDGTGKLYTVFMASGSPWFIVYDRNGAMVSRDTLPGAPTVPPAGWTTRMINTDYNQDGKQELLIAHLTTDTGSSGYSGAGDELWLYQSSSAVGVGSGKALPLSVELGASYPNPTFSLSRVEYSLPAPGPASLRLFDVSGREVRTLVDGSVPAGRHEATWDGRDAQGRPVPAGAYFYQLNAAGQRQTRRVVRLR